ncbi:hypothetical protein H7849_16715 [Alloacidobacterium dinghuense]|uniref:Uncharacterized protein n=1 Tax=Alloacidobacterium dinghuense TaxID=2763107 RepID=A0A7G8BDY4_9BACT|nr:hypothetical protein [Alloacidobacterium dinghuense]QNI30754.1 hypothetical protein H7849_16715 [Alloacidobacterium dinghuense]
MAGVIAGTVILFLSLTEACLEYQRQMIAFADRAQHVSANGIRRSLSGLLESVPAILQNAYGDKLKISCDLRKQYGPQNRLLNGYFRTRLS